MGDSMTMYKMKCLGFVVEATQKKVQRYQHDSSQNLGQNTCNHQRKFLYFPLEMRIPDNRHHSLYQASNSSNFP